MVLKTKKSWSTVFHLTDGNTAEGWERQIVGIRK
jgi:hypothetical protein